MRVKDSAQIYCGQNESVAEEYAEKGGMCRAFGQTKKSARVAALAKACRERGKTS